MKSSKKKEAINHFHSLPDALIIEIFNRIFEFKTLIRCSVICKRFASLVPLIQSIFFQTYGSADSNPSLTDHTSSPSMEVLKNNFRFVKDMQIELHHRSSMANPDSVFLKWKALYGYENLVETCVVFFGGFDYLTNPSASVGEELGDEVVLSLIPLTRCCLGVLLFKVLYCLFHRICDMEMLRSVVVSDSGKLGKVLLGREEILKSRGTDTEILMTRKWELPAMGAKLWYVPDLNLPVTGCKMPLPLLFVIRPVDRTIEMEKDIRLVLSSFGEEEEDKMFDEAVMAMMNNKKKKTYGFEIPSFNV